MLTAAMAAGLTMGVVSLDELELRIKQRGEVLSEVLHANRLLPLIRIKPHHQLLVTLLLLNSVANEALPLFLDKLVPQWAAILISVSAVLFVGEIIPAAIFTGPAKMRIAAALTPVVWTAVLLMYPLAYPIGWALDKIIPERSALTSRAEVRALVDVQREIAAERGAPHASPGPRRPSPYLEQSPVASAAPFPSKTKTPSSDAARGTASCHTRQLSPLLAPALPPALPAGAAPPALIVAARKAPPSATRQVAPRASPSAAPRPVATQQPGRAPAICCQELKMGRPLMRTRRTW